MFCTCDASDTEGSESDYHQAGDPNFIQQQSYGQPNGYGGLQKPPSFMKNMGSPLRSSQQMQSMNAERQGSQQRVMSNDNALPACTCGDRRSSSVSQQSQQDIQRTSVSKSPQRTSFNLTNGPPPIGEQFPGQLPSFQGQQQFQYPPQPMPYQQAPLNDQQIQTGGSLMQPGMQNSAPRLSQEQNGKCQSPVCRGGPNGMRRASQSSFSNQPQIPQQNGSGMLNQLPQQQSSQQQVPQANGSGMLNQPYQVQQIIAPCCARGVLNGFNNSMPPNGGTMQNIQPPSFSSPGGAMCFCPTNPGPTDPGAQDNGNGNDFCESCAQFEQEAEDTGNAGDTSANEVTPICPCDDYEEPDERLYAASCACDEPPNTDDAGKADGNGDGNGAGKNGDGENDFGKKNGFFQQLQFQIYQQCDGGNNSDAQQADGSKNNSGDNQAGNANGNSTSCPCDSPNGANGNGNGKGNGNENGAVSQNVDGNDGGASSDGKTWQQLTLDIFQSHNGSGGTDGEKSQQGGWHQQLRLMIYQERCDGGGPVTTTITNGNGGTNGNNGGKNGNNGANKKCAPGDECYSPHFPPTEGPQQTICGCDL